MAVDLQICMPQESILLNSVRFTSMGGLNALRIQGSDFRSVDEVVINEMPSPDVVILSKTELIAQLPDSMQLASDVSSVTVLSRQFSVSPRSLIRFRVGNSPGKVRGILRLIQLFLKILLQTPGSDIFNPEAGGGGLKGIGETFGQDEGQNILTDFVIAVTRTNRQIIAMQARDQRSPRDERLLSATVAGANFDKTQGALYVSVHIVSQAGKSAITNVEL
jgi:hypothetical protein